MLGRENPVTRPDNWKEYNDKEPGTEYERVKIDTPSAEFRVSFSFEEDSDKAQFYYKKQNEWVKFGKTIYLQYTLEQFMGCRIGLTYFSTRKSGGFADFSKFRYDYK